MSIEHLDLGVSCSLSFTVKPYDAAKLRARAEEISGIAADVHNWYEAGLNELALTVIDPAVSSDLLCKVVRDSPFAYTSALRLEELGDAASISCLIAVLPTTSGQKRDVLVLALRRLRKATADAALQEKIDRALQDR